MQLSSSSPLSYAQQAFKAGTEDALRLVTRLPWDPLAERALVALAQELRDEATVDGAPIGSTVPSDTIEGIVLTYLMGVAFRQGCEWASGRVPAGAEA